MTLTWTSTGARRWALRAGGAGAMTSAALLAALACSSDSSNAPEVERGPEPGAAESRATVATPSAKIERARARFASRRDADRLPVLRKGAVASFDSIDDKRVLAVPRIAPGRGVAAARVELPTRADGAVTVRDVTSGVTLGFRLEGAATSSQLETADGIALYAGGGPFGADLLHRVDRAGTEDYVVFETRPAVEAVRYFVDVSRVAGLRLVDRALEFLDEAGTPRLRMSAPYLVSENGGFTQARVTVSGCAVDSSAAAPWGRAVTPPGSTTCAVRISWDDADPPTAYPAMLDPTWTATSNTMTITRSAHTATLLNDGRVLIAGGEHPAGASTTRLSTAEIFDPTTNTFAPTMPMSGERSFHVAALLTDGKVLVVGGIDDSGTDLGSAEVFDPATSGWTSTTGPMATARRRAQAITLNNGRVLVTGGISGSSVLQTTELFNPTPSNFTGAGAMLFQRHGHTLTKLDSGQILVAAGITTTSTNDLEECELFEQLTTQWNATDTLTRARYYHAAAKLGDGSVLVAGGYSRGLSSNISTSERFNPGTGMWTTEDSLSQRRQHHTMTTLANGGVLAVGGAVTSGGTNVSTYLSSAEVYDATADRWSDVPDMSMPRLWHTATLLNDDRVLIAGGEGALGAHASAELFAIDPLGAACTTATTCNSGFCVDGFCCESDCTSGCFACANTMTGAADGQCEPVTAGTDPDNDCDDSGSPTCTLNGACDGAGACAMYSGSPCTPEPCTSGSDCASNRCYDGICCDSICSGTCDACTAALKGYGEDGVCEPIMDGLDPDNECPMVGSGTCAAEGVCNGSGSCHAMSEGTVCGAGGCTDNLTLTSEALCDQNGECTPSQVVDCAPYLCDSSTDQCTTSCTSDSDCAPGLQCSGSTCQPLDEGEPCVNDGQCQSNRCVDGFCCNQSCNGQCEACDLPGDEGRCMAVTGEPRGDRPSCGGDPGDPCAGECDGSNENSCTFPDGDTVCGADSTCEDGIEMAQRCDGNGSCGPSSTDICSPFVCGADACIRECSSDSDCVSGFACSADGSCEDENSRFCSKDNVVHLPNGELESCGAYRCVNGRCRDSCSDDDDCADGNICPPQLRTCGPAKPSDDGGCGCRVAGNRRSAPLWLTALALVPMAVARRRRRPRS